MSANPLDIRTAITQIQEALTDAIDLAYRWRYPEAENLSALAEREAAKLPDRALVFVTDQGVTYRWLTASTLTPVAPFVIAPNVLPATGNGRWVRQSSSVTLGPAYFRPLHRVRTGYARTVQILEGEDEKALERIYGQSPAFLVEFIEDKLAVKSYAHGAIYDYDLSFVIHCMTRNFRDGADAVTGSRVAADSGETPAPGLYRMIGDLRYLLGGCQIGLAPGVKFVDVTGRAAIPERDLAQRYFRAELEVRVAASLHVIDEDLISNPHVWIERRDAGTASAEPFDAANYVAQGYGISPQPGLNAAPELGVAYIGGQLVTSQPGAHLFEPDADTYRFLRTDGTMFYVPTARGDERPPTPNGSMLIGVTSTDASNIAHDTYLCNYSVPSGANPGDPFRAA